MVGDVGMDTERGSGGTRGAVVFMRHSAQSAISFGEMLDLARQLPKALPARCLALGTVSGGGSGDEPGIGGIEGRGIFA
jgi:hypothetical protein